MHFMTILFASNAFATKMRVEMPEHLNANAAFANYANTCKHKPGLHSSSASMNTITVFCVIYVKECCPGEQEIDSGV